MTAKTHRSKITKGFGDFPNLRSRLNAVICFSEKNFFGIAGKPVCSVLAVKVADFAQDLSRAKILF